VLHTLLARLRAAGARVEAGELRVRFADPAEEKAREKVT
jgi:hypothetical protein